MRQLSARELTLCQILADDDGCPAEPQLKAFLADPNNHTWATANDVASIVAQRAAERLGWASVPAPWPEVYEVVKQRIAAYLTELDRVAGRLAEAGVSCVVLKNGGIARGIYRDRRHAFDPGACPMGDLDVLVVKQQFRKAHSVLLDDGYQFEFRSPLESTDPSGDTAKAEAGGGAEYWKKLPGGEKLWLELQWRPVAGRWIRPDQEPAAEEFMARSIPISGTAIRLLAPEDNLLQVALHTAKHSYVRAPGFRLHLDVERIVRAYPALDWNRFLQKAISLQVKTAVYFSLAIPVALFATPVPPRVLAALRPPAWRAAWLTRQIEKAGLFNPDERKFGKLEYLIFTALLYDDAKGLMQGIFPSRTWMRQRYGVRNAWLLPYYYASRVVDLTLRRART
jgi:hypothetical protein